MNLGQGIFYTVFFVLLGLIGYYYIISPWMALKSIRKIEPLVDILNEINESFKDIYESVEELNSSIKEWKERVNNERSN